MKVFFTKSTVIFDSIFRNLILVNLKIYLKRKSGYWLEKNIYKFESCM